MIAPFDKTHTRSWLPISVP